MWKDEEDSEDKRNKLLLIHGRKIVDSFNEGDYLTIADFCEDYEGDIPITEEYIDLDRILSKKRYIALNNVDYDDYGDHDEEKENELDLKILRLYKVIQKCEDGIPIVKQVKFPGEGNCSSSIYSLLTLFNNYIEELCNSHTYDQVPIKVINEFAKLDSNYADSIILESTYVPYEQNLIQIRDVEKELDVIAKKQQKERIARARREKREEDQMWKGEFERIVGFGLRRKYKEE